MKYPEMIWNFYKKLILGSDLLHLFAAVCRIRSCVIQMTLAGRLYLRF